MSLSPSVAVTTAPTSVLAGLFSATLRVAVEEENVGALLPAELVCPDPDGDQGPLPSLLVARTCTW